MHWAGWADDAVVPEAEERAVSAYCIWVCFYLYLFIYLLVCFSLSLPCPCCTVTQRWCVPSTQCTLCPSLHPQGVSVLFILYCFLPFSSSSLLFVSCSTMVSDVVMYAPHVFDPSPLSPVLRTLHNHLLVSLEVNLNSFSLSLILTPSYSSFFLTTPTFTVLSWLQSRSSLLFHLFPSSNSKPWKLEKLFSLPLRLPLFLWCSHSPLAIVVPLLFPHSCVISHPFSPLSSHLPLSASFSPLSQWSH